MAAALLAAVLAGGPTTADGLDLSVLAQYGVVGLLAAAGILFARNQYQKAAATAEQAYAKAAATADAAYQREQERADRLEEENRKLNALIIDRVIPAVGSASRAAEQSAELLSAAQREREQIRLYTQLQRDKPQG